MNASIPVDSLDGSDDSNSDSLISNSVALSPIGHMASPLPDPLHPVSTAGNLNSSQEQELNALLPSLPNSPMAYFRNNHSDGPSLSSSGSRLSRASIINDENPASKSKTVSFQSVTAAECKEDRRAHKYLPGTAPGLGSSSAAPTFMSRGKHSRANEHLQFKTAETASPESKWAVDTKIVDTSTERLEKTDAQLEQHDEETQAHNFNMGLDESYSEDWPLFDPLPFSAELLVPNAKLVTSNIYYFHVVAL